MDAILVNALTAVAAATIGAGAVVAGQLITLRTAKAQKREERRFQLEDEQRFELRKRRERQAEPVAAYMEKLALFGAQNDRRQTVDRAQGASDTIIEALATARGFTSEEIRHLQAEVIREAHGDLGGKVEVFELVEAFYRAAAAPTSDKVAAALKVTLQTSLGDLGERRKAANELHRALDAFVVG